MRSIISRLSRPKKSTLTTKQVRVEPSVGADVQFAQTAPLEPRMQRPQKQIDARTQRSAGADQQPVQRVMPPLPEEVGRRIEEQMQENFYSDEAAITSGSPLDRMNKRAQDAPNIKPLGEVSMEKMERLFGQAAPKKPPKSDPAPSRAKYKMQRLWLTPMVRSLVHTGVPVCLALGVGVFLLSDENIRANVNETLVNARNNIQERPEFKVELMKITGASEVLSLQIRQELDMTFPLSSFELDLAEIKDQVEQMDAVKTASLFLRTGNLMHLEIQERMPVILWRKGRELEMLDENGERAGVVLSRLDRLDLPLIAGEAAEEKIEEALLIFEMAKPIQDRLRGLRRVGARRWDIMLGKRQVVNLPEDNPVQALERLLALQSAQKILDRDVLAVDMRDSKRPIVRLSEVATEVIRTSGSAE